MKIDTNQKKLYAVLFLLVVLIFFGWNLAVKKTFYSYLELSNMEKNLVGIQVSEKALKMLEKEHSTFYSSHPALSDSSTSVNLFKRVTELSEKSNSLEIVQFPEIHIYRHGEFVVETMNARLSGSFKDLLQFVFDLEHEPSVGEIASVHFKLEHNLKLEREDLMLEVLIQNVKKSKTNEILTLSTK